MILPKLYQIKTQEQKRYIILDILDSIKILNKQHYPNVVSQLENDNSKINLIDMLISNKYSKMGGAGDWKDIIDSIEATID